MPLGWCLLLLLIGCGSVKSPAEPDADSDADTDTDADSDSDTDSDTDVAPGVDVDLLVVVDDSNSMSEEQASLDAAFASLLQALVTPPIPGVPGVATLQVGIVSTDMGVGPYTVPTCDAEGDDAILQNVPRTSGCDLEYPRWLDYDAAAPDLSLEDDFECIATLGTDGCGFERQLDAAAKAVTTHAAAGEPNEGFVRENARLLVLIVSDENDCSPSDPTIFDPALPLGDMNLRCMSHPEMLEPIASFVDRLQGTKPGHPERVSVAAIVGVPTDLVTISASDLSSGDFMTAADYDAILDDPRMAEVVDPEVPDHVTPSCDIGDRGKAYPPRRIVDLVRSLDAAGSPGVVQSICQADWSAVLQTVALLALGAG